MYQNREKKNYKKFVIFKKVKKLKLSKRGK